MTKKKNEIFSDISDLLYYSIEQNNEELARKMITFLTKAFIEFRENKEFQEIIYPNEYYDTIFEANELVCLKQKRTISSLNGGVFLNLFIDGYQKTIISDKTFTALWVCVRQVITYDKNDIFMSYWANAHQHFGFFLDAITPIYDNKGDQVKIVNKKEIEIRETERNKFLEFHYVIGGLLVYLKKYNLLKSIFNYTNQIPPVYYLIPGDLNEIINGLLKIKEDFRDPFHYEQKYSFPDIDGVNRGSIIRYWIKKYFAILFLRQYTLHDYYYGHNIFDLPIIPNSLSEMKVWENELKNFKLLISDVLGDQYLLEILNLNHLTNDEWFTENNKQHPIELIDKIVDNVKNKYQQKKINQDVSIKKEKEFYDKTRDLLEKFISKVQVIENKKDINDFINYPLTGTCQLLDKTAFADDQDISYLNSDSIVAESLFANLSLRISRTFSYFIKESYLFEPKYLFIAINEMGFDFNNYDIISFGVNLKYYSDFLKIDGLQERDGEIYFKDSKIINLETYLDPNLIGSLIIVNKENLPKLSFNELSGKLLTEYSPDLIVDQYHLYAKLIDLNVNDKIRNGLKSSNVEDLTRKVLACILINWEIKWRKGSEVYQFKVFEQFNDSGKPNTLSDLKPISKKK